VNYATNLDRPTYYDVENQVVIQDQDTISKATEACVSWLPSGFREGGETSDSLIQSIHKTPGRVWIVSSDEVKDFEQILFGRREVP
jgi:hypothetical protein